MAYTRCGGGGIKTIPFVLKQNALTTGTNVEYEDDCYVNDIIVVYNFSYSATDGYATPVTGCELVDTFYVGYNDQHHPITVLRATANHIKFKIVNAYIAGVYTIFSKAGKSISTTIQAISTDGSRRTVTKSINSKKDNVIVVPHHYNTNSPSTAITITYSGMDFMSDPIMIGNGNILRIAGYRGNTDSGSSITVANFEVGKYILLQ